MIEFSNYTELPSILENGFVVKTLPVDIQAQVNALYTKSMKYTREEADSEALCITGNTELNVISRFSKERDNLIDTLLPLHENIFKRKLIPSIMYGVRRYNNGSILDMHLDKPITHHVGSIMVVDKDLNGQEDWPLHIIDNGGIEHKINLNVGDIFYYESARLLHGRPTEFKGHFYSIIMTHLALSDYKYIPKKTLF